jgi:hypothetical protein
MSEQRDLEQENKALEEDYLRIIKAQDEKHRDQVDELKQEIKRLRLNIADYDTLSAQPKFCCELSYKAAKQKAWNARRIDRCKCDHNEYCDHCWPADFRPGGKWHGKFVAQQSTHVSVPRELARKLVRTYERSVIDEAHWTDMDGEITRLRALLNGGEA